jgi:hypothetical protein
VAVAVAEVMHNLVATLVPALHNLAVLVDLVVVDGMVVVVVDLELRDKVIMVELVRAAVVVLHIVVVAVVALVQLEQMVVEV